MTAPAPLPGHEEVLRSLFEKHVDSYRVPKIPSFFREDPSLWFMQVESSLAAARITTQKTMADIVISALSFEEIAAIKDILSLTPQPQDLFDQIKARIISNFSTSAEARLRRLLKGEVLTEGKPSQILMRLRNLNDGSCTDEIIRAIFMEQLPAQIRTVLAMSKITDPQEFAELADKVVEASGSVAPAISSISPRNSSRRDVETLDAAASTVSSRGSSNRELEAKVDRLTNQLAELTNIVRRNSRDVRRRTTSRRRSGSRSKSRGSAVCRLHRKYGSDALHCIKPCSWQAGN